MSARMSRRKLGAYVGFQARQIFSGQELQIVSRVLRVQLMDCVPMYGGLTVQVHGTTQF